MEWEHGHCECGESLVSYFSYKLKDRRIVQRWANPAQNSKRAKQEKILYETLKYLASGAIIVHNKY